MINRSFLVVFLIFISLCIKAQDLNSSNSKNIELLKLETQFRIDSLNKAQEYKLSQFHFKANDSLIQIKSKFEADMDKLANSYQVEVDKVNSDFKDEKIDELQKQEQSDKINSDYKKLFYDLELSYNEKNDQARIYFNAEYEELIMKLRDEKESIDLEQQKKLDKLK